MLASLEYAAYYFGGGSLQSLKERDLLVIFIILYEIGFSVFFIRAIWKVDGNKDIEYNYSDSDPKKGGKIGKNSSILEKKSRNFQFL